MQNNNLEKIAKGLLFLVPILPLLFIDGYFYPFVIFRTAYFYILIIISALITAYLLYKKPDFVKRFNLRRDKLLLLFGFLVLTLFVTGAFGWNFYNSFFSTFERMEGISFWIFMFVFYLLLRVHFVNKNDWLKFFKFSYIISFIISVYGILQKFSFIDVFHAGIDRAESTLGNPAFFGSYLLIMTFLGLWIYLKEENIRWKYIWFGIGLVNLFTLFLTLTRSSILGLAFFVLLFLVFSNFYFQSKKYRIFSLSSLGAALLFIAIVLIFRENLLALNYSFINRVLDISLDSPVINNRILVWKGTLENWQEYVWSGVGIGNFNTLFNKFYTPAITEDWFDKTHNAFLDMFVSGGIVGLLSYLGLYLYPIYLLFKKRKESIFAVLGISFFIAYAINNLFVFDTINTAFLIVAILAFISYQNFKKDDQEVPKKQKHNLIAVPLIIFSLFSFYFLVINPFYVNHNTYLGYSNVANNKSKAYASFEKIKDEKYASNEISKQILDSYNFIVSSNSSLENQIRFFNLTKESFEFARTVYPQDIRINLHLAQLIINYYNNPEELIKAEPLIKEAIERSPYRAEGHYLLAQLYIKLGEEDRAIETVKNYSEMLPNYADPVLILANITYSKDKELAMEYFEKGINMDYDKSNLNYERILEFLLNQEDYESALSYYEILVEKNPNDYNYRIDLFQVYYLTGSIEKAMEQILYLEENNPEALENYQEQVNIIKKDFYENE